MENYLRLSPTSLYPSTLSRLIPQGLFQLVRLSFDCLCWTRVSDVLFCCITLLVSEPLGRWERQHTGGGSKASKKNIADKY